MTTATKTHALPRITWPRRTLSAIASRLRAAHLACLDAASKARECDRLYAMSDRQLAGIGLTRDGIPRYVFRGQTHG